MRTVFIVTLAAIVLHAADYRAGLATLPSTPDLQARCLVIEDRKGALAAIVSTDLAGFPRSLADPVAARLQKTYGLDRAGLLLHGSGMRTGAGLARLSEALEMVVGAALRDLAPAGLRFAPGEAPVLVVTDAAGKPRAVLSGSGAGGLSLEFAAGRTAPARVRGPLRFAFRVVDLPLAGGHLGQGPNPLAEPCAVQAMAFGDGPVLLVLGGGIPADSVLRVRKEYGSQGLIVAGDPDGAPRSSPYREDAAERATAAIRQIMERVGRKR